MSPENKTQKKQQIFSKYLRLMIYSYLDQINFVFKKASKLSKIERENILNSNILSAERKFVFQFQSAILQNEMLELSTMEAFKKKLQYLITFSSDLTLKTEQMTSYNTFGPFFANFCQYVKSLNEQEFNSQMRRNRRIRVHLGFQMQGFRENIAVNFLPHLNEIEGPSESNKLME